MSAVEAIKLARKGISVRSLAKRAGVPLKTAQAIADSGARGAVKDLQRENARLRACLRQLVEQYDMQANELAVMARQVECVKTAAAKLVMTVDYRLKCMFDVCNDAEDALAGKIRREPMGVAA